MARRGSGGRPGKARLGRREELPTGLARTSGEALANVESDQKMRATRRSGGKLFYSTKVESDQKMKGIKS